MVFKGIVAAATAVALSVAPTVAVAQTAAPSELAPAAESAAGSELRGGFIIPLIALIAIILGLCVATDSCGIGDDDDLPTSP